MFWSLEDFADFDLSTKSPLLSRKMRRPHKQTRLWSCLKEALRFPLSPSTIERTTLLRESEGLARRQLWICKTMTSLLFERSGKGTDGQHVDNIR